MMDIYDHTFTQTYWIYNIKNNYDKLWALVDYHASISVCTIWVSSINKGEKGACDNARNILRNVYAFISMLLQI